MTNMTYDHEIDARGLLCPLPVLKIRKQMQSLPAHSVLRVEADDPAAIVDIPHYCSESGHILVAYEDGDVGQVYFVRKG